MLLLREYETWLSAHRQHALSIGGNGALHTHRNSYLQAFVFRQLGFLFVHFNCMWLRLHYIYNWMFVLLAVWHCSIRISFSTFCFLFSKLLMLLNFVVPAILICLWKWDECWTRTTADFGSVKNVYYVEMAHVVVIRHWCISNTFTHVCSRTGAIHNTWRAKKN